MLKLIKLIKTEAGTHFLFLFTYMPGQALLSGSEKFL